jgi:hypothetical protein
MDDRTMLIQGGFFMPLLGAKKVKAVTPSPNLMEHVLEHGRPETLSDAAKQERIKQLIKEMQTRKPSLTFVQAWTRLQQQKPELFN